MAIKRMTIKGALFLTLLLCCLSFLPKETGAQVFSPSSDLNNLLSVDVIPHTPRANENVTISIQSFRTDLNKAEILWFVNGDLKESGTGLRTFTLNAGKLGTVSRVQILMKPTPISTLTSEVVIAPADVDLFWQTNNYVPPFYKGKSLYTYGSILTVTALPSFVKSDGTTIPPGNLIYKWYTDTDNVLDKQSGYGKSSATLPQNTFQPQHLEVDVVSVDNTFKAHGVIDVNPQAPQALLYEDNPILGVLYNKALDQTSLVGDEITLAAVPYFFTIDSRKNSALSYDWSLNNKTIAEQKNNPSVVFRKENDVSGTSNVRVIINNLFGKFQQASAESLIQFGNTGTGVRF